MRENDWVIFRTVVHYLLDKICEQTLTIGYSKNIQSTRTLSKGQHSIDRKLLNQIYKSFP